MASELTPQGELETITFGEKILTVKRKCSCGGDVEIKKAENGVNTATCLSCGVSLTWGTPVSQNPA